ncbi:MAG: sulfotransferase domain-containing protein [Labilithrix sp.]|nr:sulfotransferase domain-containing protein [Labilithrix sp.]
MDNDRTLARPARTLQDYLSSSHVWSDFLARGGFAPGDVVVADPFKAGTTWTQRILQQILDDGEEPAEGLAETSPWLDSSWGDHAHMLALLEERRRRGERRVIKSHLPADTIPIAKDARYVFVGRNGKDIGVSFHNYLVHFSADVMRTINRVHAERTGDPTPLVIPARTQEFFDRWLDADGYGCCDLFDVVGSWWRIRTEPNVLLVHYADLLRGLPEQIARIARFIGIDPARLRMDRIVEHAGFDYMRSRAERYVPFGGKHMTEARAFFDKGPRRDHRVELTPEQIRRFDRRALDRLGRECALWLEHGAAGAPNLVTEPTHAA